MLSYNRIGKLMVLIIVLIVGIFAVQMFFKAELPLASGQQNGSISTENLRTVEVASNYVTFNEPEKLDQFADAIVLATVQNDFLNNQHIVTTYPDGNIQDFYTLTDIKIARVIKESTNGDINEGEILSIIEPVGLVEETHTKLIAEDYSNMQKGEYILIFLKRNSLGQYAIFNLNNGKFDLDSVQKKNAGTVSESDKLHEELKDALFAKYDLTEANE
ncbi:hypothetical protein [Cohnella fermenti]|uniref:Uncharacterized protein n=1 Tax=Cohnella fermenti TaxID=2565925 RepID=A0A4S4C349_9BACL|nr:hypothetical protein [Cohnella fermenti]THF82146.1 hypothetical protein E6C55_07110 [Cohnella fermenti]